MVAIFSDKDSETDGDRENPFSLRFRFLRQVDVESLVWLLQTPKFRFDFGPFRGLNLEDHLRQLVFEREAQVLNKQHVSLVCFFFILGLYGLKLFC